MQSNVPPTDPVHTPAPVAPLAERLATSGREVVPAAPPARDFAVIDDLAARPAAPPPERAVARIPAVYLARTDEARRFLCDAFRQTGAVSPRDLALAQGLDKAAADFRVAQWRLRRARREWGSAP